MNIRLSAARKTIIAVLALICVFFLTLGVVSLCSDGSQSISASAETTDYTSVSSGDNLSSSISSLTTENDTGSYKLTSNITVSSAVTISSGTTVNLDLNGHTLTLNGVETVSSVNYTSLKANTTYTYNICLTNNGTLNIQDSASGGAIVYGGSTVTNQVTILNNATLNISGSTVSGYYTVIGLESSTINITGGNVSSTGYAVTTWGTLNVSGDAKITASGTGTNQDGWYYGIRALKAAKVTISDNAEISAAGSNVEGVAGVAYFGAVATNNTSLIGTTYTDPLTITINGGTISGYATDNSKESYAISGNGTYHYTDVTINGGTITCTTGTAYYHPEVGDLTITDGTFTGLDAAVEIRSGSLTITGGSFYATYNGDDVGAVANGNGTTVKGAAIGISQHTIEKELSVNITGGTFSGVYSVLEKDTVDDSGKTDTGAITAVISGGEFTGDVKSETSTTTTTGEGEGQTTVTTYALSITGGTYTGLTDNTTLSNYVASGLETTATTTGEGESAVTTYSISLDTTSTSYTNAVLMVVDGKVTEYESFAKAFEAKSTGAVSIWLNGDVTENITIPAGLIVTLDLNGNEISYSNNDDTILVESEATLLVKDSKEITDGEGNVTYRGGITTSKNSASYAAICNEGTLYIYGGSIYTEKK